MSEDQDDHRWTCMAEHFHIMTQLHVELKLWRYEIAR